MQPIDTRPEHYGPIRVMSYSAPSLYLNVRHRVKEFGELGHPFLCGQKRVLAFNKEVLLLMLRIGTEASEGQPAPRTDVRRLLIERTPPLENDVLRSGPEVLERRLIELSTHEIVDGLNRLQGKTPQHAASRELLASVVVALEEAPDAAVQMVHILSKRLATRALTDATAGDSGLLNLLVAERLTDDPNANYFVQLCLSAVWNQSDPSGSDKARLARENLLSSYENLERNPRVASNAVRALAHQLAALIVADASPELGRATNFSATELSVFLRGLGDQ